MNIWFKIVYSGLMSQAKIGQEKKFLSSIFVRFSVIFVLYGCYVAAVRGVDVGHPHVSHVIGDYAWTAVGRVDQQGHIAQLKTVYVADE